MSSFLTQKIHSLKYLLSAYSVPGTLPGYSVTVVSDVLNTLKKFREG